MIIGKNIETLLSALRDSFNRLVYGKQFLGYQGIDISGAVPSVYTLNVPAGATEAIIQVEGTAPSVTSPNARYTLHGVDPGTGVSGTATGHPLYSCVGSFIIIKGYDNLKAFRVISTVNTGTQGLKVQYYK